jgi:hypothetical protein
MSGSVLLASMTRNAAMSTTPRMSQNQVLVSSQLLPAGLPAACVSP